MRTLFAILFCAFAGQASATTDYSSGNHMLPMCRMGIDSDGQLNVWVGQCGGAIAALAYMAPAFEAAERFCPPKGYSVLQARRIVVRYMEQRPEDLHLNYLVLALRAMQKAWPCSRQAQ